MKFTELELNYLNTLLFKDLLVITDEIMNSDDKIQEKNKFKDIIAANESCSNKIEEMIKQIDK